MVESIAILWNNELSFDSGSWRNDAFIVILINNVLNEILAKVYAVGATALFICLKKLNKSQHFE